MKLLILVLLSVIVLCYCYPEGAPSCKLNVPSHEKTKAKSGKAPYNIVVTTPKTQTNGEKTVTVTISGIGSKTFKGFHMTARVPNSSATIGKFTPSDNAKILQCNPSSNAITHKDNEDKESISFSWSAPKKYKGKVEFRATIVKEYKEFYTNVKSSQVVIN
ncbi:putative defense protein 2 [Oppia nitens]|uniref:putative defense protein 2 n=1 Tax=Oppia nitens TaxID=1686743 RepID=UPI0023DB4114|nr:putative defense protein 2 [Oppia nitens]